MISDVEEITGIRELKKFSKTNKNIYLMTKRILDLILSSICIIFLSPIFIITAIAIKLDDKGSVIYKQLRMGKDLRPFYIYKFRTMTENRKELQSNLSHENMVTRVGKILRATSIDELPQLFNILKGEMTFIGPRPWILEYYEWFTPEQKRRCEVKPGISGLAQVKGRNGISIFKKIEYDIEYVDNISLKADIKIFFESIIAVFKKTNAEITEVGIKEEINQLKEQFDNTYLKIS